jgi:hypothetical protein
LGRHESLLISGLFAAALHVLLGLFGFSSAALVTERSESSSLQVLVGGRHCPNARKDLGKFKNASGIKPRLKIENFQ